MYQIAKPLFLLCQSPLHAGSGSDLGVVDLPIQRERHTDFPKIEGSSLKGSIRERFEQVLGDLKHNDLFMTFGPEDTEDTYAGALGFTDARLLLFPVKSMRGVFAWITCPRILSRFREDMRICEIEDVPSISGENLAVKGNKLYLREGDDRIVLDTSTFHMKKDSEKLQAWSKWLVNHLFGDDPQGYWAKKMETDILVLSNDDFTDFVKLSTEVITRTKIDNLTGTVEDGALFTEEYLPADSVMYSLILASPVFPGTKEEKKRRRLNNESFKAEDVMDFFKTTLTNKANNRIQTGANATLGKGLIQTVLG
ncbi:MAG: type III-B CRISPR module RAMP protein Cmr4 [Bacteroidota bacterium]